MISIHCFAELIPYQIAGGSRNWNWHHHFPFIVWLVKKMYGLGGKLKNYRVNFFFVAKYVIRVFLVSQKLFYWFIINIFMIQLYVRARKSQEEISWLLEAINFITKSYICTYRVLQTIQMKLITLCVWAEPANLGSTKTALKFKYKFQIG